MTFIAFLRDPAITLTTDQLVIAANEVQPMNNIVDMAIMLTEYQQKKDQQLKDAAVKAYEKSYADGMAAGIKAGEIKTATELTRMVAIAHTQRLDLQKSVAKLAIQVVNKVAGEIGAPKMVTGLAQTAASDLVAGTSIKLWVHSSVVKQVSKCLKSSNSIVQGKSLHIDIRSNDNIDPFDCILDTDFGQIVASLDDQLKRLENVLSAGLATEVDR